MTKTIKTMDELKDSRIMFDKKFPPFGYMIVLIVLAVLIGILLWSMKAPKIFEVISTGTVTNADSNYVMSPFTGEILRSNMEEGLMITAGEALFSVASTDYDLQTQQLKESRMTYEARIAQFQKLVQSIQDNTNYFSSTSAEDSLYYSTFETYRSQVAQNSLDTSAMKAYGYSDAQIEAELEKNQSKVSELYYSAIQSAERSIDESRLQISSIDAQLTALQMGQENYTVTAPVSGVLHLLADYKAGMVVQTGAAIATITPENGDAEIEAYVSSGEVSRIHEGDSVEMEVNGLMQSVYGTISGTVTRISSNATSQEGENGASNLVFKVLIQPDSLYVVSNTGDKVNLKNGMTVEARVQYKEITYFDYVMQKLGVKAG